MRKLLSRVRPWTATAAPVCGGSSVRWAGLLATVTVLAVAVILPARALAAYTVIGFDDLTSGARVTTQYASSQGVEFGTNGTSPPEVWAAGGVAASPPNVARLDACPLTNPGCEFPQPYTDASFVDGHTRQYVSVNVGMLGSSGSSPVTLTAYDAGSNVVGQDSATVTAGSPFNTDLTVNAVQPNIAYFEVGHRGVSGPIGIDNVAFDNPTVGTPDFLLGAAKNVKVLAGSSTQTQISLERLNGSTGNVALAIAGLPAGVTGTITPNPVSGSSAMLTLSAEASAQAGYATATLTGTPADAGAGPGPHSQSMTIEVARAFSVEMPSGTTADLSACHPQVPVSITRDLSFPGPVALALSGLPLGVSASFSPSQATFPNGVAQQTVTLTLTAPADGLDRGSGTITVIGTSPGWPSSYAKFTVHGACPRPFDVRVQSIQVTQGVQDMFLPTRSLGQPADYYDSYYQTGRWPALLGTGRRTIVRVYANASTAPSKGVPNVGAELLGYLCSSKANPGTCTPPGGKPSLKPLPGGPLLPEWGPRTLQAGAEAVSDAEAADPNGAYTFTLPDSWTHYQDIWLRAVILPPAPGTTVPSFKECGVPSCLADNTFDLVHVEFTPTASVTIAPYAMTVTGQPPLPGVVSVFDALRTVTPLNVSILPYQATIDITDIHTAAAKNSAYDPNDGALSRLRSWIDVCPPGFSPTGPTGLLCVPSPTNGMPIGVTAGTAWGLTSNCYFACAVVDYHRPLTSVAHEFFHMLGRKHASTECGGGQDNDKDDSGGQVGEAWPPPLAAWPANIPTNLGDESPQPGDGVGDIQSLGLDPRPGSGTAAGQAGPYEIFYPTDAFHVYDFMSYCAGSSVDRNPPNAGYRNAWYATWVSLHNWNWLLGHIGHAADRAVASTARRTVPGLRVVATVSGNTTTITSVAPRPVAPTTGASSPYRLIVRNAAGAVLSDQPMTDTPVHIEYRPYSHMLEGDAPVTGAAEVEIASGSSVLAVRNASAHAPVMHIIAPRRGARVGGDAHSVTIRWQATDTDHDPLLATVEYSADAGRTWKTAFVGPNRGRATLPAYYLQHSRNARVRVRANDGFNETAVVSGRFVSLGASPLVSILSPAPRQRITDDASLYLSGTAVDDTGRFLKGRQLRWYAGGRLLGSGNATSVTGLPPGNDRITLTARDSSGRTASATVAVRVLPQLPRFLTLRAPPRISPKARTVRLTIATSLPATLTIGRRTYRVNRGARTIIVTVEPGRRTLVLRLRLRAFGQTHTTLLNIPRR